MNIDFYKLARPIGIISILICIFTWWLDLAGYVHICPYCRTQRTVIGLLGVLLLIRKPGHIANYIALVLGFYGCHLAAEQSFSNFVRETWSQINIYMATGALMWMIAQVYVVFGMRRPEKN